MSATLHAGAAMVEITPPLGTCIPGVGCCPKATEIRDPLHARALVLENDGRRCAIVSCDLKFMMPTFLEQIREEASSRFGIAPEALIVHPVQNHAAPGIGHHLITGDWLHLPAEFQPLRGSDEVYNPVAVRGILQAISQAAAGLQPVTIHVGRGVDGRVAFNRRFIMRDGTVTTQPHPGDPNILQCEGPTDPEVAVMTLVAGNEQPIAVILHHSCHPAHGFGDHWISAGWPGAWADGVRRLLGPACIPLVLNGACGNVHTRNYLDPAQDDDYREIGRKLTETTARILQQLHPVEDTTLHWAARKVLLPLRSPSADEIAAADALLTAHPVPQWLDDAHSQVSWDWVYAASQLDLAQQCARHADYEYEIRLLQLGPIALLTFMGEPFVEAQLEIKRTSPAAWTFVAHMCGGIVSYLPTRHAYAAGGYETRISNWSRFQAGALEQITEEAKLLLLEIFAG